MLQREDRTIDNVQDCDRKSELELSRWERRVNRGFQKASKSRLSRVIQLWCTALGGAVSQPRRQDKASHNSQFANDSITPLVQICSLAAFVPVTSLISWTNCYELSEMQTFWKVSRFAVSPWLSSSELCRPNDRRFSAKLVPTFCG
jgi:hypothetical protein